MIHQLKIEEQYFKDKLEGLKPFEIRKRDRDFRVGDFLALNEVTVRSADGAQIETGRCCLEEIMYMLDDSHFVQAGCVILSTRPCLVGKAQERLECNYGTNPFKAHCYGEKREGGK